MDQHLLIRTANLQDIPVIQQLAHQVWPVAYGNLMTADRLQYMLQLIYSEEALQQQMQQLGHTFLLATIDTQPVGFAAFSATVVEKVFKLQKIYINTNIQGKGIGKKLIDAVIERIKPLQAVALILNVKRDNPARTFYEKLGFVITKEEDIDIGNGYFMNDYVMEKKL